jgi:hypothetical protein
MNRMTCQRNTNTPAWNVTLRLRSVLTNQLSGVEFHARPEKASLPCPSRSRPYPQISRAGAESHDLPQRGLQTPASDPSCLPVLWRVQGPFLFQGWGAKGRSLTLGSLQSSGFSVYIRQGPTDESRSCIHLSARPRGPGGFLSRSARLPGGRACSIRPCASPSVRLMSHG